ncbi:MAG: metalloprotease TldD, partial [Nitrospirae bacterium]
AAPVRLAARRPAPLYPAEDPVASLPDAEKVRCLEAVDRAARAFDPRVDQVVATLAASHTVVAVATLEGGLHLDVRPLVRLSVQVTARQGAARGRGASGGGGRGPLSLLAGELDPERLAREAARQAVVNLEAAPAPAGHLEVVLGPGWPGILLHEAVGHGLEGDFNRKGTSAFAGRLGERVAAPGVTVVDDATLEGRRGSLAVDDEGVAAQETVLIEDGVLVGYLQDRHNGRLMGQASTGNGRRQSFAHLPLPRMTNTFMRPGPYDPEEIVASVADGLYAVHFSGGQVDITSGKFVFAASEAYRIRNGRIAEPVRDATLIGNGPDCLTRVAMVGNDLKLDLGVGTCGKCGQSVPVGVGLPTVKIAGLTVGGTA